MSIGSCSFRILQNIEVGGAMPFPVVNILGLDFVNVTMNEMIQQLEHHVLNQEKVFVVTGNPEIVMFAEENQAYKEMIKTATYITPDGVGIVKASKYLKRPLQERVTGFDMLLQLLQLANEKQFDVFLLGAKQDVLNKTIEVVKRTYPSLNLVGTHHGYFDLHDEAVVHEIKLAKPDLIFVAMGVPRQEKWIASHLHQFDKGIFLGVGGSFDVLSGYVKRAPVSWQNLSAEWLYRFLQRPTRGKRIMALPQFVWKVIKQKANESR